ncbi:MAG: NAD-dependent epimerase/dehydratase family protein [Bdellovibrionota bacterium]
MKILVSGATGFLGQHLVDELRTRGHDVTSFGSKQVDLTKTDSLSRYDAEKFERIFHLAAWTQAGDFCLKHPGEQWIINQKLNTNVLTWWRERQPQAKLISIGTSCSYDPTLPLEEENYLSGIPIESLFTNAMTKRMLYTGQLAFQKQFGLKWLTVVPSTLYGGGYHTDGRQMHFIFDLIRKIIAGKKNGDKVVLWGDGHQKRELVHVRDFAKILIRLDEKFENELVNIGAGEEHSIREFAATICKYVGYDEKKIEYDTTKYVGAKSKFLGVKKLRRLLPDYSMRSLDEGIRETVLWFEQHAAGD